MRSFIRAAIYLFLAWAALYAALEVGDGMHVAVAGPVTGVHYDKNTGVLTVHVQNMPLNEILQTVSTASGLKLSIQADLNRPVTMDFTAVPLDKAIHRLVQPNSSAMIYSKKEDGAVVLSSVKIFDKGGTPSSPSENLPVPRVAGRRNNRFAGGNADQAIGSAAGGDRGGPPDQGGGGRNKRNRGQQGGAASDSGSQASGAAGATGSQSTAGGSSGGGSRRSR